MTKAELIEAIRLEHECYLGIAIPAIYGLKSKSKQYLEIHLDHCMRMNTYYSESIQHPEGTLLNVLYRAISDNMWLGDTEDIAIIKAKEYCRSMIQ